MGKKIIIIAALAIIISLVVFNYYPRSLERVAGTEGITANDISQIKISLYVYKENPGRAPETEKITNNEIIGIRKIRDSLCFCLILKNSLSPLVEWYIIIKNVINPIRPKRTNNSK